MNVIRKFLGLVWMLLGPVIVIFLVSQAFEKIMTATEGVARTNTTLQWSIIILIFIPICTGLMLFGLYSWKGEFDRIEQ